MKRTCRGTTKASYLDLIDSVPQPQRGDKEARLAPQKDQPQHGPPHQFKDTIEVEDVAAIHNNNVEVDVEPTERSRVGSIDPSLLTSF
ncbi:hypothetical protein L3X38_042099 [Prunus dulcis]|uniref:Uncharacterized protein n=1 Tax=Prunus dulcis TaxID=3755 RepID=A0AAD4YL04_PRUDU|nr:hypothetical protein L3X38_042099 [Prunus dulcis]